MRRLSEEDLERLESLVRAYGKEREMMGHSRSVEESQFRRGRIDAAMQDIRDFCSGKNQ